MRKTGGAMRREPTIQPYAEAIGNRLPCEFRPRSRRLWWKGNRLKRTHPIVLAVYLPRSASDRQRQQAERTAARVFARIRRQGYTVRIERRKPPKPRTEEPFYTDRTGRELPIDDYGRPLCPRCGEHRNVAMQCGEPYCTFCRRSVRWSVPKRWLPDF